MITSHRTDESFLADKSAQAWSERLMRTSTSCPANIDILLAPANPLAAHKAGKAIFPQLDAQQLQRTLGPDARPAIGVLLDDAEARLDDASTSLMATRYASLAIEKECEVIILSHQSNAGFERFGFRVERIAGKTAAEQNDCIAQIRQFWGLEIMI
ncbi:hypothetical protein [Loktanella sp. Alg231-35]|uniref:hypothetical protein n=1 Tax=Loktanella sp. Alg231-35 TaxID=1922220 RepID=UPI000D55451F|nr:hypothetical protein [Loktanella sp. Alg231-35]